MGGGGGRGQLCLKAPDAAGWQQEESSGHLLQLPATGAGARCVRVLLCRCAVFAAGSCTYVRYAHTTTHAHCIHTHTLSTHTYTLSTHMNDTRPHTRSMHTVYTHAHVHCLHPLTCVGHEVDEKVEQCDHLCGVERKKSDDQLSLRVEHTG